jgi:hypothetical protein
VEFIPTLLPDGCISKLPLVLENKSVKLDAEVVPND